MVAEPRNQQLLVLTCVFSSILWDRSFQTANMHMRKLQGTQASLHDDLADLESFRSSREEIRTYMLQINPSLYEVLGEIVSSKQPIREGDVLQTSQRNLMEAHRALRALQAKIDHASFKEDETHQSIDEYKSTEADKLQTRKAERQLGCLLVMKTKGETQLQVCGWLTAANSNSTCIVSARGVSTSSF